MELSVRDRLLLLQVLPREGDYTTLKLVRTLREELSFNEAEHAVLQFKDGGGTIQWEEAGLLKDVVIGEKASDVIVMAFKRLDAEHRLHHEHLGLYEKFVIPG